MEALFGIDLRSLAALRIGMALLLLADLLHRSADLTVHYTDLGVLPRAAAAAFPSAGVWSLSPYFWTGTPHVLLVLFILAGAAAVALLVGYHTRWATIVSWGLLTALHVRNPLVCQSGDTLLRLLLFWSMFLPLGTRCSVDSLNQAAARPLPIRTVSMATGALLAQVVFVYWFTAAHKAGAEWWQEGSAVYYALSLDRLATPVGLLLLDLPALLPLLTYAVIWFEVLGPLLLFVPIFTEQLRTLGVGAFLLLQLGFGLCLALGLFPWISAVAMLPFVPPWFWDCCVPQFKTLLSGMARGSWTPLLPVLRELQERGKAAEHDGEDSPGRVSQLRPTSAPSVVGAASWVTSGGMALLLGYVVFFLLTTLKDTPVHMPQWGTWLGSTLQLHQRWAMFAPRPPQFSGWYVMSGRLADGTWLDLWHGGGAVRWEKPRLVSATYRNQRWRKYLRILAKEKYEGYRGYFAQYLCTQWNSRHQGGEHLEEVIIYFMREDTLPAYQATTPYPILLWQQRCTVSHTDGLG